MPKIIGIVGTRTRDSEEDFKLVEEVFLKYYEDGDVICSGLCKEGGDRFAVILAEKYKTNTLWFEANWKESRKSAGFIRNTDIARNSDILIAVVDPSRGLNAGRGTEDTIRKYLKFHNDNPWLELV
jgi:hypothetical protein